VERLSTLDVLSGRNTRFIYLKAPTVFIPNKWHDKCAKMEETQIHTYKLSSRLCRKEKPQYCVFVNVVKNMKSILPSLIISIFNKKFKNLLIVFSYSIGGRNSVRKNIYNNAFLWVFLDNRIKIKVIFILGHLVSFIDL